ncbi:MAG: hypothetical protein WBL02_00930 [Methanomethylovorans sp.]|uniref:hypothetical protein n=1 Tax=Methanomethylovorans sp. TaxID=2758717 RepID=UPI000ACAC06F|nr:hypothetical protein [Methanomethylovorans sp.]
MNHKAIVLILAIILVTIVGGCADKTSIQNRGQNYKPGYSLVPASLAVLSSHDHIKTGNSHVRPVLMNESEELNIIISEAYLIAEELDSRTLSFEEEGKDVQKLRSLLDEYKILISNAKTYHELADQDHNDCTGPECAELETELYLQLSRENLKRSNSILLDIFNEMKKMLPGHVKLYEECTLSATGTGRVLLVGDLNASISIRNGVFYIVGLLDTRKVPLTIVGKYEFKKSEKPEDRQSYYKINDATVNISVQRSVFIVEASEISIDVTGNGTVDLFGKGTYIMICPDGISDSIHWEVSTARRTINSPSIYTDIK